MTDEELRKEAHQSLVNAVDENGYTDNLTDDPALIAMEMRDQVSTLEDLSDVEHDRLIFHITAWQEMRREQTANS